MLPGVRYLRQFWDLDWEEAVQGDPGEDPKGYDGLCHFWGGQGVPLLLGAAGVLPYVPVLLAHGGELWEC